MSIKNTNQHKGGAMSPAHRQTLANNQFMLAHQQLSCNQNRPFWYEKQLNAEARLLGKNKMDVKYCADDGQLSICK